MNIVLGVCGSISAYKAHDISRLLYKAGHDVRVVLTQGAAPFVATAPLAWPGVNDVYAAGDDFTRSNGKTIAHIDLARWADMLLIAPLSANTLANLAHAHAGDLLSSIFLAWGTEKPIGLFPAMNTQMLKHPLVQQNLKTLQDLPHVFIHPGDCGELACGEWGEGKLATPQAVVDYALALPKQKVEWPKTYLITTGATVAPLDPVRYLTNGSTGVTGLAIAQEVLARGHRAIVIAGKTATAQLDHLLPHPNFELMRVVTTQDMAKAVEARFYQCHVYVSAAAIADFEFDLSAKDKLKKDSMPEQLPLKQAQDILATVLKRRTTNQMIVGFAAETQLTEDMLEEKFSRKPVDLLIGTRVHTGLTADQTTDDQSPEQDRQGFGNNSADYLIKRPHTATFSAHLTKQELSRLIVDGGLQ